MPLREELPKLTGRSIAFRARIVLECGRGPNNAAVGAPLWTGQHVAAHWAETSHGIKKYHFSIGTTHLIMDL